MLPESILLDAQQELLNWQGHGMSILEIGHRTPEFVELMEEAEADLRELMAIPDHYHVLFLGSAARTQFSMIPMNLLSKGQQAGYLISGIWSSMAYDEACKLKQAYCIASSALTGFHQAPTFTDQMLRENTAYVYYTPNETINGVRFATHPSVGLIPVIADMTSCLLSEPLNVTDFGLIFAGAQKNIACAGLTIVIIRDDLLNTLTEQPLPTIFDYRTHVTHHSLYATPPTFNCYLAAKMFKWIKAQGGVSSLHHQNSLKAAALYQYIDASSFYDCPIEKNSQSLMNICFALKRPDLEGEFLQQASLSGLLALKGHRATGGLRASIYNAMPMAGVEMLIQFMDDFSEKYAFHL